jgi:hypothetical protein
VSPGTKPWKTCPERSPSVVRVSVPSAKMQTSTLVAVSE